MVFYVEAVLPLHALAAAPAIHVTPAVATSTPASIFHPPAALPAPKHNISKTAVLPSNTKNEGGPTQPEMEAFHSANTDQMVNLFTGDFNYTIPLVDVGGYPLTLGYNSGISMDQEASWVGLGWGLNPGAITRNMRGLPDDFNGTDSITRENKIEENKTVGVTAGADIEVIGFPKSIGGIGFNAGIGFYKNSIRGWGMETSVNANISVGSKNSGHLSGALSINNNSQTGVTISPSIGYEFPAKESADKSVYTGSFSITSPYNSRSGMKGVMFSGGMRQYAASLKMEDPNGRSIGNTSSSISFASPAYTPGATVPFTSKNTAVTIKLGTEATVIHPSLFISGYINTQKVDPADQRLSFPAYGYLNYQNGYTNTSALLDFNRERDITYRETPAVPNIAIPSYTYDVFTIAGEGAGGAFRAYRNDVGYVFDPLVTSRDKSLNASVDVGFGYLVHGGVDLGLTRAYTRTALWETDNPLKTAIKFTNSQGNYESVYFRNPAEKTINSKTFYDNLGGDQVVTAKLNQSSWLSPSITSVAKLTPYKNATPQADIPLSAASSIKPAREKRTQVITYLTASEATEIGLSKYIENYKLNTYPDISSRTEESPVTFIGKGNGLIATYYHSGGFQKKDSLFTRVDSAINFKENKEFKKPGDAVALYDYFNAKYEGRLKVPHSGRYIFKIDCDDGWKFFLNGDSISSGYRPTSNHYDTVYMEGGRLYPIKLLYTDGPTFAKITLAWRSEALGPNTQFQPIAPEFFFKPYDSDTVGTSSVMILEKRVTSYRKPNHISEVNVLNADGKKYVYGIPVYNLDQKEATFFVNKNLANSDNGLVKYTSGVDDAIGGPDKYYSGELIPSYAHSFLLTGILSPDYVDVTGNGITDDDIGNAIRFNYTKTAGASNPYRWRIPYNDSATYNIGLKSDFRDDKGSYVRGSKELWYLNSVESKNMIAVFRLGSRKDQLQISSTGVKSANGAMKLEKIDIYSKADYRKNGTNATPIKTVHFEYTYQLCPGINGNGYPSDSGKLTLKRVWFSYNGNTKGRNNSYLFVYNSLNPGYNTQMFDRWGNYKPATDNPGSVTGNIIQNSDYPYALQDSILAARNAAAWTLDSIITPAGGRLKINYESDDYGYVQNRRAMQLFKVAGLSANAPTSLSDISNNLYSAVGLDYKYISINVPVAVKSNQDLYNKYLEGISKIYFRMYVSVPSDTYGNGYELIPCYARIASDGGYGYYNGGNTIWVKISGIDKLGHAGTSSPLVVAAFNFIKQNLPSKAYPGSDNGDGNSAIDAVKLLYNQAANISQLLTGFDVQSKIRQLARKFDPVRSLVRLNSPVYKKYGGGLRVKSIISYDHWNKMTGQRESRYGKSYQYTTTKVTGTDTLTISSGVAAYEPLTGGEENPFRQPIEYLEEVTPLAPVVMGYTEEPLGETFFPAPTVGYSKVRVRSINADKVKSANGFEEYCFYTAKEFPVITERTTINSDTKKRFKNNLADLLKINSLHYLTISQGFKVELNDMHGQLRSRAVYGESDPNNYIAYTENFYHVDNQQTGEKHLKSEVPTMGTDGSIKSSIVGKDMELMVDFREQSTLINSSSYSLNSEVFMVAIFPVIIPSYIRLPQREENRFRSVGTTKVINRHGIIDSIVAIDKGSKVVTRHLLYDEESGDPVLSSVQNEFNDDVYTFNYPAAWVYEGMGGAYKNIGTTLNHIDITNGKITAGLSGSPNDYFFSGDEILAFTKRKVFGTECSYNLARWPVPFRVWAVDANMLTGGTPDIYFINQDGSALTGNDITLKITRSGRRNIAASGGTVTMLHNPIAGNELVIDENSGVVNASVATYSQFWKVSDRKVAGVIIDTFYNIRLDCTFVIACGGTTPSAIITVPAGTFSSVVSQEVADDLAGIYMRHNGLFLARQQLSCPLYWNTEQIGSFQRSNCTDGGVGFFVKDTIAANTFSSYISVADANNQAIEQLAINGQARADATGKCQYFSDERSGSFLRTTCPGELVALPTPFSIPAGSDSSEISKEAANELADLRLQTEGQAYADEIGRCKVYAKLFLTQQQVYDSSNSSIYHYYSFENVDIHFFADAACTIRYTPGDNITVGIKKSNVRTYYQNGTPTGLVEQSYSESSFSIGDDINRVFNQVLFKDESLPNTDPSVIVSTFLATFTLLPSDDYIIVN
ncbi:DUF5977 domain-containing protein [Chitinophaga sp. sic0106]|uniref:DUF5977 domain-containing protein n=1 Tax=Chitinophaga sp. sic0106 TaxID=2854785 RepID=UPI001C43C31D|nr:DUF5977 domain-containing protein [Chitinophaga sp. sic0106]